MRALTTKEAKKRGCAYCTDSVLNNSNHHGRSKFGCIHEECPYHILDDEDDFLDWLRETSLTKVPGIRKRLMNL